MHDQLAHNKRRSLIITLVFLVIIAVPVGALLALAGVGPAAWLVGLVLAGAAFFVASMRSTAVVLKLGRAVPADPETYARLHNVVQGLCVASGLPKPGLYVIDDAAPNAFAAGRRPEHAVVAVTTGLLDALNRVELEAVLAFELSQIKSGDTAPGTLAVTTVGFKVLLADLCVRGKWWNGGRLGRSDNKAGGAEYLGGIGLALLALSPLFAKVLHLGLASDRVALTDISAVEMTRFPPGLVDALEKLSLDRTVVHAGTRVAAHLWLAAPIAMADAEGSFANRNRLFAVHPPLEERIAALRER